MTVVKIDPNDGYPWATIEVDRAKLLLTYQKCKNAGVRYRLGAKPPTLNSVPGSDFRFVDCSGMVRWLLWGASVPHLAIPDGSVNQQDWIKENGFKKSTYDAGLLTDNILRIAFLSPLAGGGIGHVALILNGSTIESHGGTGPDRRVWGSSAWMKRTNVYVIDPTG